MTVVKDFIYRTRRILESTHRTRLNKLSSQISDSDVQLTLTYDADAMAEGSYVCLGDEVMLVWQVNHSAKELTVERGMLGTTAVDHAAGTLVEIEPVFPQPFIRDALRDEIRSWGNKLYRVDGIDVTYDHTTSNFALDELPTDALAVLEVLRDPEDGSEKGPWVPLEDWRVRHHLDPAEFDSGRLLVVNDCLSSRVRVLRVIYSRPFDLTAFEDDTNVEDGVGLAASMVDIPPLGAAARLLAQREPLRSQLHAQPSARSAEQVPPGISTATARSLRAQADARIDEEYQRLLAHNPVVID